MDEELPPDVTEEVVAETPSTPAAPAGPETVDTTALAEIQQRKMDATRGIQERTLGRMEQDRARIQSALDATGVQAGELLPWDHEQQSERYRYDPIEAFGSLGSVFAMVASAFTRQPMMNAFNGAAAAMNAVKQGNEKEYTRAFEAWKQNTDLAIKRHNIQNQYYQNAIKMMETNMAAGRAQLEMVASRFGDERTLFLLNNGLDKEVIQLQASRADAIAKLEKANENITLNGVRRDLWSREIKEIDETVQDPVQNAGHKLQAFNRIYGRTGTPQQEAMGLLLHEMRGQPAEKIIERAQELGLLPRAGGVITRDRMGAEEIQRRMKQYQQEFVNQGMDPGQARTQAFQRATREVDIEMARMTGGQVSTLQGLSDAYRYSIQTIDKLVPMIERKLGPVGTPGYLQRGKEILLNLVGGSNSVEYQQIAKEIDTLKIWASRNLLGRDGRPLSAEHAQIDRLIAGLSFTDTAQNTIKTYQEIKKLYAQMQRDIQARIQREPRGGEADLYAPAATLPGATGAPSLTAPPRARPPAWSDAPPVQ